MHHLPALRRTVLPPCFERPQPMLDLLLALLVSSAVFAAVLLLSGLQTEDREFIVVVREKLGLASPSVPYSE